MTIPHLVATVLHSVLDVGELRIARGVPRDVLRAATGETIPGLV
jgi:hypothetical protein